MSNRATRLTIPDEIRHLTRAPALAWPTVCLFFAATALYSTGMITGLTGALPTWAAVVMNAIAVFWFFTVMHDAAHNSVSTNRAINDTFGQMSAFAFSVWPVYKAFRFVHMQHHRFANADDDSDPDRYCGNGPKWQLPLRWVTMDFKYYVWYLSRLLTRPKKEQVNTLSVMALATAFHGTIILMGFGTEWLLFFFLPARLAIVFLAFAFDYLPHTPYKCIQADNPWQATSNRMGFEAVLTPVLLYQNYHLVHHLYPLAPFYRYIRLWKMAEPYHLSNDPLLVSLTGKELQRGETPDTPARAG